MTYGIIAAMRIEAERIEAAMTEKRVEEVGGIAYTIGRIGKNRVVCAVCGVGKVYAAMCAQAMIVKYTPDCIINTGVGGTLTRELTIGDVAVSENVVQHDMDTTPIGDPAGLIGGLNEVEMPADPTLVRSIVSAAEEMGIHTKTGTIASGDQFVASAAAKERISRLFHPIACEMEGAAVGQVCRVNGVPFAVVRAISDDADGGACADYPAFAKASAERSARLVLRVMEG